MVHSYHPQTIEEFVQDMRTLVVAGYKPYPSELLPGRVFLSFFCLIPALIGVLVPLVYGSQRHPAWDYSGHVILAACVPMLLLAWQHLISRKLFVVNPHGYENAIRNHYYSIKLHLYGRDHKLAERLSDVDLQWESGAHVLLTRVALFQSLYHAWTALTYAVFFGGIAFCLFLWPQPLEWISVFLCTMSTSCPA